MRLRLVTAVTRPIWRRMIAIGVAGPLLAAALVMAAPPSPASAATCSGTGCTGLDPASYCSTTSTPEETWISSTVVVQVRYSSGCNALWGRAIRDCNSASPPAYVKVIRQIASPYGYYDLDIYYSSQLPCSSPGWTKMVGNTSSDRVHACYAGAYDSRTPQYWPASWWTCTDWVYNP